MKKLTSVLLTALLLFSLTACTQQSGQPTQQPTPSPVETSAVEEEQPTQAATDNEETGKTLVVYYSATGSTERVAQAVAGHLEADIFVLAPVEPYDSSDLNWTDGDSRVSREHNDESLRNVELTESTVENWADYDTVFVGYPIWWGIAAWPVNGFVQANDFTGKTVIPFCTSSSSGLGQSGELLSDIAGTGNWLEGHRFSSSASADDVTEWVDGLELG